MEQLTDNSDRLIDSVHSTTVSHDTLVIRTDIHIRPREMLEFYKNVQRQLSEGLVVLPAWCQAFHVPAGCKIQALPPEKVANESVSGGEYNACD